jgi:PAS domain S-box-containing protein
MLVLDQTAKILFANPQAERLTQRPAQKLVGMPLDELFHGSDQKAVQHLIFGFEGGDYPTGLDFVLAPPAPRTIAAVDFSPVLGEGGAVLATMRDVTAERGLARELSQTKEFLERVIDSSVDGIVSADLKGNVLIYNRAAAKLFGYAADEVLGCLTVDKLYPSGVARDIMRRIRRAEYGGEGRLEEYRVEMLTKSGALVPVNLSASLVLDGKRPIGTVGIFTDIREKLAMEERLSEAQAQLEERRRTDAIAEVAGAAAHELNQPLTSVMGYAEYLKRRVEEDEALTHAVEVILSETQRMADIVRKVGRITRYETKPYVGGAKIVDLDASSNPEG